MNPLLFRAAAAAGLLAVAWVAAGYLQNQPLAHLPALAMTLLIGAAFAAGVRELHRFQQDTTLLQQALDGLSAPPDSLAPWLAQLPAALRPAVQARVAGERVALPGPALTPYLVGLLVLLGMLGTFLGMVVTLNGTGLALDRATDVQTMRDSLAAPVRGLGLAFGTSVAGVAASALLGLMSALCRRARVQTGQALDGHVATTLRPFTPAFAQEQQRQQQHLEALALQQQQAQHLPALVNQLQALAMQMATQFAAQQAEQTQQARQAQDALLARQQQFQAGTEAAFRALAQSVDQTLQRSLEGSAKSAAATLQPAVEATMAGITRETAALHGHIAATVQQQLEGFAQRFEERSTGFVNSLGTQMGQQGTALLSALHAQQAEQQAALLNTLQSTAGRITQEAEAQARSTVAEVARLVQTATEAPREAVEVMAEVVAQLRDKLSESLARDNAMLDERSRIMDTLNTLLGAVQHTATEQKAAIDRMVASTARWLDEAGARFTEKVDSEGARLDSVAAQLTGSAAEVASLGEAFGSAVTLFAQSSGQMVAQLQRVEEQLARTSTRSDEQLAYYVAQAREVIDLSLLSQKQIVDDLQRLARQQAAAALPAPATTAA